MKTLWIFCASVLFALGLSPLAAQACVQVVSPGYVDVSHFDPFSGGGARRNFSLSLELSDSRYSRAYFQFVDPDSHGENRRIGGKVGPYTVIGMNGKTLIADRNDAQPPQTIGNNNRWMPLSGSSRHHELQTFTLDIDAANVPAGVYETDLDIKVACQKADGSFDYDYVRHAVQIGVEVDNVIALTSGRSSRIDLGDLSTDGAASHGDSSIGIRSSGPYEVAVKSNNSGRGDRGGVLQREGVKAGDDKDSIDYTMSLNGNPIQRGNGKFMCAGAVSNVKVGVDTGKSPAKDKRAGTYSDIIEVTFTPNFYGASQQATGCSGSH